MAFNFHTAPTTAGCYSDFLGFPSKYNTLFNKESTFVPSTVSTPFGGFPTTFERSIPTPFWNTPSTFGAYPWSNTFGGAYPWSNTFGGAFPWSNNTLAGAFPWSNTFGGACPSAANWTPSSWTAGSNWTGSFPTNYGPFGANNFNNNTLCASTIRPSSEAEYFTLKNPIRFFEDGTRGLWLCFDLRGYKPEEVCVTINKAERCIIVEANQEVKEHGVARKFYRKFALPEYMNKVDITKIDFKSFFGPDGMFYVEGAFARLSAEEYSAWPAYPYTLSCWTNPSWFANNNSWTNNSTWAARPWNYNNWSNWTNWSQNSWNVKPITCKLI
jgi:HSP20 family molecular chaperone IbpA